MADAMPAALLPDLGRVGATDAGAGRSASAATTGTLGRELWALGAPAVAHMLLVTVVFAVQRLIIGHYDSLALASLQVSALLVWTLYSLFGAVGVAALGLIGRAIGAGDRARAAAVARLTLRSAAALGVLAAVPLGLFARPICRALFPSASGPVLDEAERYLLVVTPALPFALVEGAAAACLQGAGDTRTPLYAAAAGNVLHVVVAATLVGGAFGLPELGVRGAALGAAVAFTVQALWLCHALYRTGSPLELRAPATRRQTVSRALARLTWPLLGDKLLYHTGDLAFVAIIGLAGASAMAANQALLSVEAACFLTAEGLGVAAATLVAHKLGAGQLGQARRVGWVAAASAAAALAVGAILFVAAPRLLVGAFTRDAAVVELGAQTLWVAALAQPFMGFATVAAMSLRGAGASRTVLVTMVISSVGVRLGASYLLGVVLELGLPGAWLGSTLDWIVRAVALGIAWWRGGWQRPPSSTSSPRAA